MNQLYQALHRTSQIIPALFKLCRTTPAHPKIGSAMGEIHIGWTQQQQLVLVQKQEGHDVGAEKGG